VKETEKRKDSKNRKPSYRKREKGLLQTVIEYVIREGEYPLM
jgi:hypothetical protein